MIDTKGALPTQRQMNEAFYVDVCQAEDRLREFIEAGRKLLDTLPPHWHGDAETALRDLCDETSAVLNPHLHTAYQVEQATKRYGRSALLPSQSAEKAGVVGWRPLQAEADQSGAPWDGVPVLICTNHNWGGESSRIHRAKWTDQVHGNGIFGWAVEDMKFGPYALRGYTAVTHWMPLPAAPASPSSATGEA